MSRNPLDVIWPNFQGFFGAHLRPRICQNLGICQRGFEGGVGKKKFDPPYLPYLGVGEAKLIFPLGAPTGATLLPKPRLPPTGAPPKIRDCLKKFCGVGTWTRGFEEVVIVRMVHNFFRHLGWKTRTPFFIFFRISTQGLSYALSKNGQIFDF